MRCSGVRKVDVGRGSEAGCLAGSPWREAQEPLKLSGSERGRQQRERDRERGKVGAPDRKTEMKNEREKGYLWISQPSAQRGGGGGGS